MDYSLCAQVVTVYRKTPEGVLRLELPGCYLQWREEEGFDRLGRKKERKFLLIQPGQEQLIFPGDRVFDGVGPEITSQDWGRFIPELVENLGQVAYAAPYWWQGRFCHTEAGRK